MVEKIEEISRDFHFILFPECCRLPKPRVKIPQAEAPKWVTGSIAAIRADIRITKIGSHSIRISEYVRAPSRSKCCPGYSMVSSLANTAGINRGNHIDAIGKRAAPEIAAYNWQRQTAVGPKHTTDVPAANNSVKKAIIEAELVPGPTREIIVKERVKDMRAIEQGRPILKIGIKAGGVCASIVLHSAKLVE